jgi:hypothetical protein
LLKLDRGSHTATLISQYRHGDSAAACMGNAEFLRSGNVFVGWGAQPYFSEYSKSGKLLLDGVFPSPDLSYRATKVLHWTGLPLDPPRGAARRDSGTITVYASWNGATRVAAWRVLAGTAAGQLTAVATRAKSGFETAIRVSEGYRVFRLQALDAGGQVIGTSHQFRSRDERGHAQRESRPATGTERDEADASLPAIGGCQMPTAAPCPRAGRAGRVPDRAARHGHSRALTMSTPGRSPAPALVRQGPTTAF